MTQFVPFHDQRQGSFHSQQFLRLPELCQFRGKLDVLLQVDFVRIEVLHIVPSICLRVLTRTL